MTDIPSDLLYTKEHEWIKLESDGSCLVGITNHAQDSLGDVTFVEMPNLGQSFEKGSVFGVVESVKAASDLYMPISGEITGINEDLNDSPEIVNTDPYAGGWIIRVAPSHDINSENLLDASAYKSEIG